MLKAMQYIRDLEAVGIPRNQAEVQIQVILDAVEGDLVTKNEFKTEFALFDERIDRRLAEFESRLLTRLGFLMISCTSVAIAILTWLIKLH